MSGLSLKETDPVLQIYEAQAIIVEKDQEIERLKQENERLQMENSSRNQQELAQKVAKSEEDLALKNNYLAELLENLSMKQNRDQEELSQKISEIEEDLTDNLESVVTKLFEKLEEDLASKNDHLSDRFETLEFAVTQKMSKLEEDLAASKADNLQLKEQITALHLNISKNDKLSDKVEELVDNQSRNQKEISQKVIKIEQEQASSKNKNLVQINHLTSLEMSVNQPNENKLRSQQNLFSNAQNAVRIENKVEKESGEQQNTSVLILGGSGFLNTIYLLDSKAQSWKELRITLPIGMQDFGAVVLNEEIYIFGGYANRNLHQGCYKLKNDGSWMKLASLNKKRAFICSSSLVYKGDIWAIGGYSGNVLKSVEKYNISQDKWTYIPEMNDARCNAATAVFKDRIFVTGGESKISLKSVEMFDPKLQKWILFCDLPIQVMSHTMLINNSNLSIFGGSSEFDKLNSVWEMNVEDSEKKWTKKESFKRARRDFGIGKLSYGIIIFGGFGCLNDDEISEIFDGNEWIDGPRLLEYLSSFAYTCISRSLEERFLEKFS